MTPIAMDELTELRIRLNNNLLASDMMAEDFARKAGIGAQAVKRFLLGPHDRKTHYTILEAIQRTMRAEGWLPPIEPVSAGVIQALVEEQIPQLSLDMPIQEEPVSKPKELTKEQRRFLTYAIWNAHAPESLKQELFAFFSL